MSEPLFTLDGAAGVSLTDRQAHAFRLIRARQPVRSDALGAELHAYRHANGGNGHQADTFCDWCTSEGRSVGEALQRKGLVRYARGAGWMLTGDQAQPEPSVQIGAADPWPEDMF